MDLYNSRDFGDYSWRSLGVNREQTNTQTELYLIIINVTHISMFSNYSFNFGRNVAKRGRNMERRRERNIAEPKSYYNKRNAHFDVQQLLLQFWTERRETWQEYGEA